MHLEDGASKISRVEGLSRSKALAYRPHLCNSVPQSSSHTSQFHLHFCEVGVRMMLDKEFLSDDCTKVFKIVGLTNSTIEISIEVFVLFFVILFIATP